ncbi:MAG: wax ester/triacylglycerol synthase family O-acyltransferase [Actinobacteria bacterium]|nr:wax ester/triacylglycerol synthase family O-acyltransferase [Actinomycetota bacterium]MCI0679531.1 wax ester/triacylglycerol synthase family O-acyltransferase [Actinomycetota bacterium]
MSEFWYEPLSYLDASFLALESPTTHMHVAGVALFDAAPLKADDGGIDIDRVKAHVASKLQYIPRYRQRLEWVPYDRHPVWVDDGAFNFDYHLRHTSLPRPGSDRQLKDLAGRIVSTKLDRSKPLWELWVVEGIDDDRFAIIAKIHHCMIDGVSGIDLTTILLNVAPDSTIEQTPEWVPRPAPTPTQLAVAEAAKLTRRAIDRLTNLGDAVKERRSLADRAMDRSAAALSSLRSGWLTASTRTPLNPDLGPNRRFDWTDLPLDRVKEIKNGLGGSVNDVVLAITAGAIRRFLMQNRDYDPTGSAFRIMNPVSTRSPSQRGKLGNQVAMWLLDLPIEEPDIRTRYELIKERTSHLKRTNQALGAATLVELSSGTPITLLSLANRVVGARMRPFNMTVTNIPGPQFPMYLLESQMIANYPMVPLWAQHGIGVALFSYNGCLLWGIQADYDTLADSAEFLSAIHVAAGELLDLATDRSR